MGKRDFYVVSLKTPEYMQVAYVGFSSTEPPLSSRPPWFITHDPALAFNFGDFFLALEFKNSLKAGCAHGLRNDGHIWRVSQHLPLPSRGDRPATP